MLRRVTRRFLPPPDLDPAEWAEQFRRMSSEETAYPGRFSFALVPYFRWFLERFAQPDVRKGVCRKSAQIGWTQAVICNVLGWIVHIQRTTAIAMFPKEGAARNFDREKFAPMCDSTPEVGALLPTKSRQKDLTALFKKFPGGFIKFVGSNSIADVKSTSARRLFIEEPDDCNLNLRGQGDAIKLLEERGKSYNDLKVLVGGTPSIKGVSSIDDEIAQSDQNYWMVPCPDCGEYQRLQWGQVIWRKDGEVEHEIFGRELPETAHYVCAHCGSLWNDAQKNAAVRRGRPEPTAPFRGVLGLTLNELYSPFHNSRMAMLVERYLTAKHEEARGNLGALITFWNTALGESWEYKTDAPEKEDLEARGLDYAPLTVPAGGLVVTMGVDVQHDRIAVTMRATGRGEESWLLLWDELPGIPHHKVTVEPGALDPASREGREDAVWLALDDLVFGTYPHESGARLKVSAVSIDSGDGHTSDAVYHYCKTRAGRGVLVMATKGHSTPGKEIFTKPKESHETNAANTKAAKRGVRVYMVGTEKAKDLLIESRLHLEGHGPGRFHWYRSVRADYFDQLLSEVKAPAREQKRSRDLLKPRDLLKVWQKRAGARNEALDCEVLALHASRALKLHLYREEHWTALERRIRQTALFAEEAAQASGETKTTTSAPPAVPPPAAQARRRLVRGAITRN